MCKSAIKSYEIAISSAQRASGTNSNFEVRLVASAIGKAFRWKNISIPFTWYVCNDDRRTMEWISASVNYSAIIDAGTYTPSQMVTELNAKFLASGDPDTKTWTFDSVNQKFTVSSSVSTEYEYNATTSGLMDILGFTSTQTLTGTSVEGANVAQLNKPNLIGIRCPQMNGFLPSVGSDLGTVSGLNKGARSNSYQKVIQNTADYSDYILYDGSTDEFQEWKQGESGGVNFIDLSIFDMDTNELLDLNGANWSVVFEIMYDLR